MAFGVFIHRSDSIYDDHPEARYQFPSQYLGRAQACVGDWIVYYEPKKVAETRGYFAIAKVNGIAPDPGAPGMYVASIEPGSYMPFVNPVPFSGPDGVIERGVLNEQGKISGRAQSAVRPISPRDFYRILDAGIAEEALALPRTDAAMHVDPAIPRAGFREVQSPFVFEQDRARLTALTSRLVRDRIFRKVVLRAYAERCAVTGLKLINGGGRAEVEAAHIKPVEAGGPDIVSNGLALSGTAHWMFDRGLISIAEDRKILISRQVNDPDSVRAIIYDSGMMRAPDRPADAPHRAFLQWHRDNCFKA